MGSRIPTATFHYMEKMKMRTHDVNALHCRLQTVFKMATQVEMSNRTPKCIFVFSGKRKSGKDYLASLVQKRFGGGQMVILRLSAPLKYQYAKEHNLDYEKLLDASAYKETYRSDMIQWGEEIRNQDPGYFCRHAIEQSNAWKMPIWVISDARRLSDIMYFKEHFPDSVKTVRLSADDDVRHTRGWEFVEGVDDAESECGLDSFTEWDFQICTNFNSDNINSFFSKIKHLFIA